jgi:hypothetical protein
MAADSINRLRSAVFSLLQSDATLLTYVNGMYEYRGETIAYPYVYLEVMQAKEWSKLVTKGAEIEFTVQVVTRDKDSTKCGDILARIQTLLHHANPTVTGFTVQYIRWLETQFLEASGPNTFEGTSRFVAHLIES